MKLIIEKIHDKWVAYTDIYPQDSCYTEIVRTPQYALELLLNVEIVDWLEFCGDTGLDPENPLRDERG